MSTCPLPGGHRSHVYKYQHHVEFLLVEVPTQIGHPGFQVPGHAPNIFPLQLATVGIKPKGSKIEYVPARLCNAGTYYYWQGRTAKQQTVFKATNNEYVGLSRFTTLTDLVLLNEWTDKNEGRCGPSDELAALIQHIQTLNDTTTERFRAWQLDNHDPG